MYVYYEWIAMADPPFREGDSMARKTKEESLETRSLILDTAERVFAEQGVSRTSLADIATAAGLTRGAIYWHFKNKADVFTAMTDRVNLPIENLFSDVVDNPQHSDPLGELRAACLSILQSLVHNEQRRRVFDVLYHKCELTEEMGPVMQRQKQCIKDCTERIQRILLRAIELGQLPAGLNIERADIMLHALVSGLMGNWLFDPESFDLERDAGNMLDGYLEMLQRCPAMLRP
ncbi:TetR family transcriptional regulator [Pseudogulbenkiania sp. MAI-1]|uniref:TetR family transcriptional regulator n=1 Tax=Pseudogulbenkiania sp. MAI-1 TaxID=990370 RepID=UPI001E62388F|nr:TetR family transcriptional regulator [Pseudogulbenkiania sp. MAI-1]